MYHPYLIIPFILLGFLPYLHRATPPQSRGPKRERIDRSPQSTPGGSSKKVVKFSKVCEVITPGDITDEVRHHLFHYFANRVREVHPDKMVNMWSNIKRRLNKDRRRLIKQKAVAGVELVGAGAALTGGSILMEKMIVSLQSPSHWTR